MKKIGLTLSGGGARGVMHLGVLQAFDELGITVDMISGSSAGAIVGAFYAAGYKPHDVLRIATELGLGLINPFHLRPFSDGIMNMDGFAKVFKQHIPHDSFAGLRMPLYVATTDIVNNKTVYFHEGPLSPVLMATACVQVMFETQEYGGYKLHDGGILNNLPTEILRDQCDLLIGVHCNSIDTTQTTFSKAELTDRTFHMAIQPDSHRRLATCDLQLEPPAMSRYGMFDVRVIDRIFQEGYDYTMSRREEVLRMKEKSLEF